MNKELQKLLKQINDKLIYTIYSNIQKIHSSPGNAMFPGFFFTFITM